jgi:HlyD family secretion protein
VTWLKRAAWILVGLVVVYAGYRGIRTLTASRATRAPAYATAAVGRGPVTETVSDPGVIVSATSTQVVAGAAGHVTAVGAAVGQVVKAGDVVAELSDDQGLGASVASAQAALVQAQSQLAAYLNPAVNTTDAQITAAQLQVQQAQLALAQQQTAAAKLTVAAPFAGVVTDVAAYPGQPVGSGQNVLTLADNSQTWAVVQVDETLLPQIAAGGPANVTIQGTGATVSGHILQIDTNGTPTGKAGQTFPVTIALDHPVTGVMAGMTAIASITPTGISGAGAGPISATGSIAFRNSAPVTAQQSGTVTSVASVGQTVAAGDPLAVLANPTVAAQLQQAQISLQSSQNSLDALLHPQPAAAPTITAQQAQVDALQQSLALRQQAYGNLQIRAPITGQITAVSIVSGTAVAQGTAVMTMMDPNALQAQVSVDELDVAKIKVGQSATVTVNALPGQTYTGKVSAIAPTAVVSSGVSTYAVTIDLPSVAAFRSGMSVQASIQIASVDNAVRVPAEAVQSAAGRSYVLMPGTGGGAPTPRAVETGVVGDAWTQIVSGLQPGDVIVVAQAQTATTQSTQRAVFQLGGGERAPAGGGGGGR